jgi:hypothetical protein
MFANKTRIYGIAMQRGETAKENQKAKGKCQKAKVKDLTPETSCQRGNRVGGLI